jgi:hypothetical protein
LRETCLNAPAIAAASGIELNIVFERLRALKKKGQAEHLPGEGWRTEAAKAESDEDAWAEMNEAFMATQRQGKNVAV